MLNPPLMMALAKDVGGDVIKTGRADPRKAKDLVDRMSAVAAELQGTKFPPELEKQDKSVTVQLGPFAFTITLPKDKKGSELETWVKEKLVAAFTALGVLDGVKAEQQSPATKIVRAPWTGAAQPAAALAA